MKELRVAVKGAELKYAEAHASNTRKQNEIERLSQARTQMHDVITQLKTENSELRRVRLQHLYDRCTVCAVRATSL